MIPHLEHNIGAYFPAGGMRQISDALERLALDLGVTFHFCTPVEKILVGRSGAYGLVAGGKEVRFDVVVNDTDIFYAYPKLLPNITLPWIYKRQQPSTSAMKIAGDNPYVLIDKANAKQFTPGIFGGDYDQAVGFYKKSIAAFERMDPSACRWVYLNALANLGTCYEKMGQYANAEATYRKALAIAPNFDWVKNFLLPKMQKEVGK